MTLVSWWTHILSRSFEFTNHRRRSTLRQYVSLFVGCSGRQHMTNQPTTSTRLHCVILNRIFRSRSRSLFASCCRFVICHRNSSFSSETRRTYRLLHTLNKRPYPIFRLHLKLAFAWIIAVCMIFQFQYDCKEVYNSIWIGEITFQIIL